MLQIAHLSVQRSALLYLSQVVLRDIDETTLRVVDGAGSFVVVVGFVLIDGISSSSSILWVDLLSVLVIYGGVKRILLELGRRTKVGRHKGKDIAIIVGFVVFFVPLLFDVVILLIRGVCTLGLCGRSLMCGSAAGARTTSIGPAGGRTAGCWPTGGRSTG